MADQQAKAANLRIREVASEDDIAGYVTAMLAGYEIDPQFVYRYPYRKQYPEDAREASAVVIRAALANPNTIPLVAETQELNADGILTGDWTIIAVATWEWKTLKDVQDESR